MNKSVAVLTSGGDAPGMNAAVRAIVRTGLFHGYEMYGVEMGYEGLVEGNLRKLSARDVGGIMQSAGTFLGSARSIEFTTEAGQKKAVQNLQSKGIDSVIVIGGNGSQKGSHVLSRAGLGGPGRIFRAAVRPWLAAAGVERPAGGGGAQIWRRGSQ